MAEDPHSSLPRGPFLPRELDQARQTRERVDRMPRPYWSFLIAENERLAEAITGTGTFTSSQFAQGVDREKERTFADALSWVL
jgi:hypothetical protein